MSILRKENIGRILLGLALAIALFLNVFRAAQLGVFQNAPIWVLQAVPAALSNMFASSVPRYTISRQVFDAYFVSAWHEPGSPEEVNKAIARIAAPEFRHDGSSYVLLRADDKGIVDFVEFSFRTFGFKIQSVARGYYALLLLSTLLFAWRYWHQPLALASAACVIFSMYEILPFTVFNPQLLSPLALRCMPLLSLIACLHCVLYCWRPGKNVADTVAMVLQATFIVFVLYIRSTAIWQIQLIVLSAVAAASVSFYQRRYSERKSPAASLLVLLLPALVSLLGCAALNIYRQVAFPPEYSRGELTLTRPFWHNIYSGFALHPILAARESIRIDDISVIVATGRHLKDSGRENVWRDIGGESPGFNGIKWDKYDRIVRDMIVSTCKTEPMLCAETFLFYKPYHFADTLLWFYRFRQMPKVASAFDSTYFGDAGTQQMIAVSSELDKRKLSAAPWRNGFPWLGVLVVAGIALAGGVAGAPVELACMLAVSLLSMAPSIAGYPAPLGMIDSAVAFTATFQIIAIVLALGLLRRLAGSPRFWAIRDRLMRLLSAD